MSNCKAFGHLRARNHAIGQTPRNVLAPHFPKESQGSAAFDKRKDDAGETPERRRQTPTATPARHQNDAAKPPQPRRRDTRTTPPNPHSHAGETPERRRHNGCSPPAPARRRRTRINDVEPELGVSDQRVCADPTQRSQRGRTHPSSTAAQPSESSQDLPP